jgi:bifunctional DNA-binding transcriptional regulator/antitoxin component of YhaV-PrlF toxin-antitoxin module
MKNTLKVTSKGQVTFRKDLLKELGVQPGDKLTVEIVGPGRAEVRAAKKGAGVESFIGYFSNPAGVHLTIEEMNDVIAESWTGGRGPWNSTRR